MVLHPLHSTFFQINFQINVIPPVLDAFVFELDLAFIVTVWWCGGLGFGLAIGRLQF